MDSNEKDLLAQKLVLGCIQLGWVWFFSGNAPDGTIALGRRKDGGHRHGSCSWYGFWFSSVLVL